MSEEESDKKLSLVKELSKNSTVEEILKKINEIYKIDNVCLMNSAFIRDEFLKII